MNIRVIIKRTLLGGFALLLFSFISCDDAQTKLAKSIEDDMVLVEGGEFMMGGTEEQGDFAREDELPAHKVKVASFYICKYEVSQKQFKALMGTNPSGFFGDSLPVEQISPEWANKFVVKLNELTGKHYRLPTEAEWEYAARGGKMSKGYKYAGSNYPEEVMWSKRTIEAESTVAVGMKKPNELGLYDMSGNVWEICSDKFQPYAGADNEAIGSLYFTDIKDLSQNYYVMRGGCAFNIDRNCRVSSRNAIKAGHGANGVGFRLAMDVDK